MTGYRHALINEIKFWQELLSESSFSVHSPEYEKMEYALRLAEFKLSNHERALAISVSETFKH